MAGIKRKKCCNCKKLFIPDPRDIKHQKYENIECPYFLFLEQVKKN